MSVRSISVAGICFFVIAVVATFYFLWGNQSVATPDTLNPATAAGEARHVPEGWREYRNTTHHFSLLYPQGLKVNEHPEGEGASTVTFQNIERGEGFQIFILSYAEPQVSEERFKKDVPSGIRTDVTDNAVDGAVGAAFYSKNALLGEMREVWFIRGGRLYEVTTLKSLETWLSEIMQTWQFL